MSNLAKGLRRIFVGSETSGHPKKPALVHSTAFIVTIFGLPVVSKKIFPALQTHRLPSWLLIIHTTQDYAVEDQTRNGALAM